MDNKSLLGRRVLVAEDLLAIATFIKDVLLDLGCVVVGPVAQRDVAMQLAREADIDAAILDVSLSGGVVFPVAELLITRDIPFLLATGYEDSALPLSLHGRPSLTKPFTERELERNVRRLFSNCDA